MFGEYALILNIFHLVILDERFAKIHFIVIVLEINFVLTSILLLFNYVIIILR